MKIAGSKIVAYSFSESNNAIRKGTTQPVLDHIRFTLRSNHCGKPFVFQPTIEAYQYVSNGRCIGKPVKERRNTVQQYPPGTNAADSVLNPDQQSIEDIAGRCSGALL